MSQREQIELKLRQLVSDALEGQLAPADLPTNVPVFQGGIGMDSMSGVALMTAIEETFDVYIDDDQFDIFDSLDLIVDFIAKNTEGFEP
jgi:acyl carrier protein